MVFEVCEEKLRFKDSNLIRPLISRKNALCVFLDFPVRHSPAISSFIGSITQP